MTNPHHRTRIKIQDARILAEVICELSYGQENGLVVEAAKVLELHRLNGHMARVVEALDNLMSK
jgi:hypothetical protein